MSVFRTLRRGDARPPIDDMAARRDLKPTPDQSRSSAGSVAASLSGAGHEIRSGPIPDTFLSRTHMPTRSSQPALQRICARVTVRCGLTHLVSPQVSRTMSRSSVTRF